MNKSIAGEKRCEICECMFVNRENANATRCKGCEGLGPEKAGPNEKFIYQDVKRSDVEAKLNLILTKVEAILKLLKADKPKEFSHKCDTCGQVFVDNTPASKYCDTCSKAIKES